MFTKFHLCKFGKDTSKEKCAKSVWSLTVLIKLCYSIVKEVCKNNLIQSETKRIPY